MVQFTHKITKVGGSSLAVVIPQEIADELGLRERQKVSITLNGKTIEVQDWESE